MAKRIISFLLLIIVLITLIACKRDSSINFIYEDEEKWDYRPMISFKESLYFDTGKMKVQLSEEWIEIGAIEEVGSSIEPMKKGADHFIANGFIIGTKIYGKDSDLDTIYVAYDDKFIEYILQDKQN